MKKLLFISILFASMQALAQIPSYVPVYGLLSYFPLDGNGNDANGNANSLTNYGAVPTTDRFNNANAAFSFNGSTQYLINNTPNFIFNPNSTFTVSLWHNRNTSSVVGIPIMHATNAANNFIWIFQTGATNMQFGTNKQQAAWFWAQSTSTTNVWTHIVMVYNAGVMTLYKDNVLVATTNFTHTGVTSTTLPLYIGRGIGGNYFSGKIDDIGIWNRCLTTCEINDLFTASNSLTTVSAGPNLYACNGGTVTLNGTGANTYIWSPNIQNGTTFTPSINQTYTLTGINANGCSAWDQTDVLLQQFSIDAGANQSVCPRAWSSGRHVHKQTPPSCRPSARPDVGAHQTTGNRRERQSGARWAHRWGPARPPGPGVGCCARAPSHSDRRISCAANGAPSRHKKGRGRCFARALARGLSHWRPVRVLVPATGDTSGWSKTFSRPIKSLGRQKKRAH